MPNLDYLKKKVTALEELEGRIIEEDKKKDVLILLVMVVRITLKGLLKHVRLNMSKIKSDKMDSYLQDTEEILEQLEDMTYEEKQLLIDEQVVTSVEAIISKLSTVQSQLSRASEWHSAKNTGIERLDDEPMEKYYKLVDSSILELSNILTKCILVRV